jgi:hypothetical protein
MGKKHMSSRLLIGFIALSACKASSITLPKPNATTAYISATTADYSASTLEAIDVSTRGVTDVLPAQTFPATNLMKTFAHNLYIVGQDYAGNGNNLLVLEPDNQYAPACAAKSITACQFALPAKFDAVDFWVTDANTMYVSPSIFADPSLVNAVQIYNPLTGVLTGSIDIAGQAKALAASDGGEDLLAVVGDGTIDLGAMYQVDNLLFVVAQMLVTGAPGESGFTVVKPKVTSDACGYEPSRVVVIDLNRNSVVKVIKLHGANTQAPFVVEPGTHNLLIASPGYTGTFDQEPCNGIERIDTLALASKGSALTEAQMSGGVAHAGTVFSFDLDDLGNGFAFIGAGTTDAPDFQLVRFNIDKGLGAPISDDGVKGLLYAGFITIDEQRQAYISLPYSDPTKTPALAAYDVEAGTLIQTISLKLAASNIAFYPGPDFIAK